MKRNPNLIPLSREHHYGLLFCWKLKQGLQKKVSTELLSRYVRYFWHEHLREHMALEDKVLEGVLEQHDPMRLSMEDEHRLLDEKVAGVLSGGKNNLADFEALADLLTRHIRFEERELFPFLEQTLTPDQLLAIGGQLNNDELPKEDAFMPAFWDRGYQPEAVPSKEAVLT